ncbi:MAG: nucleoside deaminase, partial [Clostridiales bacterium]|nr:nucleoside deaminase [Clostridiales bacterium]
MEFRKLTVEEAENFMIEALELARLSADEGEVPVGCVIVC